MSSQSGGAEYKFNFQDLSRFVNDLRYIFRTGGNVFQAGGELDIPSILKNILSVIILFIVIYAIYYVLFKGYPRILTNVLTFSFFHKEDMDVFLQNDNILFNAIEKLSDKKGYALFDDIYKTSAGSQLYSSMVSLKKAIMTSYSDMKSNKQLLESLKEYFLFKNKIPGSSVEITTEKEKVIIKNHVFYKQLLALYINLGKYKPEKNGYDQQIIDIYRIDEKQGFKIYNRVIACKDKFDAVSSILTAILPLLITPYLAYIVLPDNSADYAAIAVDFEKQGPIVSTPEIYKKPLSQINPFSWFVIEMIQFKTKNNIYSIFSKELSSISLKENANASIVKYLNLPPTKRKLAERRVLKDNLPPEFYNFVNKRPIFSHVFYSKEIKDKEGFYNNVMQIYLKFYKESNNKFDSKKYLADLFLNVKHTKILVAYIHCMNLYINVYNNDIVRNYHNQNYHNNEFFNKFFDPFYEDFVKNRMLTKIKETFSSKTWSKSYKDFKIFWEGIGKMLEKLIKDLPNKFG